MEYHIINDQAGGALVTLTTYSPASHYGIPVVRFEKLSDYPDCGPADLWPDSMGLLDGMTCAEEIFSWGRKECRTAAEVTAAKLFLSQWPEGPQLVLGKNYPIAGPPECPEGTYL